MDRERKERENELRQMREQNERVQMDKDREIAELRNQLSRASLAPQVNTFHVLIHSLPPPPPFILYALFDPFCSTFGHLKLKQGG